MQNDILTELITMSRNLGEPANDYVILGEGNTSAAIDDQTFWVKASGSELRAIGPEGFVQVYYDRVLDKLDGPDLKDDEIKQAARMTWAALPRFTLTRPSIFSRTSAIPTNPSFCTSPTP